MPRQEVSLVSAVGWVSGLWRWLRWDVGIAVFGVLGMSYKFGGRSGKDCQDILTRLGLKLVKLGIFPKLRFFAGGLRG